MKVASAVSWPRRVEPLTIWLALLGFLGMMVVSILTVADVLLRWLFNSPIEGLEDIKSLAFGVLIAAALPAVLLHGENVVIRFLGQGLGVRGRYWLEAFGAAVTLVFFALLAWQLTVMTSELYWINDITITIGISTWPWRAAASAIVLLCVPVQVIVLIGELRRAITGHEPGGTIDVGGVHGDA